MFNELPLDFQNVLYDYNEHFLHNNIINLKINIVVALKQNQTNIFRPLYDANDLLVNRIETASCSYPITYIYILLSLQKKRLN